MGLFSDIFGSKNKTSVDGYGPAMDVIDNQVIPMLNGIARTGPMRAWNGDWVADLDPAQQQALEDAIAFSTGQGRDIADQVLGLAQSQAGALPGAIEGLEGFAAGGGPQAASMGANVMDASMRSGPDMDLVDSLINNDVLEGQIRAATRPIERQLMEQALPGISDQFGGASNAGSSRRGVAEGIATRGAIESAQDVAARMRGAAYADALGIGNQVDATNTAALNSASSLNMNAMNAADARNMAAQNTMANANAQRQYGALGTLLNAGVGAGANLGAAGNMITGQFNNMLQAGGMLQGQAQRETDALRSIYDFNQQAPWQLASFLRGEALPIAQAFTNTTRTSTPSPFQAAMQVGSAIAGFPGFGGAPAPFMGGGAPMPFSGAMPGNPFQTGLTGGFNMGNINQGVAGAFNNGMAMPF